jgi:quercetin dioxygenase-like cupin family protein
MRVQSTLAASVAIAALIAALGVASAHAQQAPSVKRTVLQKHDLRAQGQEGVMAYVEIPPGGREGRHTHPAEAFVYVLDGTLTFDAEGKPESTYKAGDSFFIEPGMIHEGINKGKITAKLVAVFVTDKGTPLTTQAQ